MTSITPEELEHEINTMPANHAESLEDFCLVLDFLGNQQDTIYEVSLIEDAIVFKQLNVRIN